MNARSLIMAALLIGFALIAVNFLTVLLEAMAARH